MSQKPTVLSMGNYEQWGSTEDGLSLAKKCKDREINHHLLLVWKDLFGVDPLEASSQGCRARRLARIKFALGCLLGIISFFVVAKLTTEEGAVISDTGSLYGMFLWVMLLVCLPWSDNNKSVKKVIMPARAFTAWLDDFCKATGWDNNNFRLNEMTMEEIKRRLSKLLYEIAQDILVQEKDMLEVAGQRDFEAASVCAENRSGLKHQLDLVYRSAIFLKLIEPGVRQYFDAAREAVDKE